MNATFTFIGMIQTQNICFILVVKKMLCIKPSSSSLCLNMVNKFLVYVTDGHQMNTQMKLQHTCALACLFDIVFNCELKKLDMIQYNKSSEFTTNIQHLHSSFPSLFTLTLLLNYVHKITERQHQSVHYTHILYLLLVYAHK